MKKPKLTPDERKARAIKAANAKWEKKRAAVVEPPVPEPAPLQSPIEPPATELLPVAAPAPPPPAIKPKKIPVPKEMRGALAYAEKRLAQAMRERGASIAKTASLNAEIDYLIPNIRALGGTVDSRAYPQPASRNPDVPYGYAPQEMLGETTPMPPVPQAHGGGMGIIPENVDENVFLKGDEAGWR